MAAEDPILAVRDLRVSFATPHGVRPILEGIGFDLQPGEILGVVGESGSGKSVTARVLLGLIPSPPLHSVSGTVRYAGQDLLPYDPRRLQAVRGKEIGLIFNVAERNSQICDRFTGRIQSQQLLFKMLIGNGRGGLNIIHKVKKILLLLLVSGI